MDTEKLYKKVVNDEEIKDIPIIVITRVVYSVLKAINSGECFNETEV